MSLRINTNIDALTAYRNLSTTQNSMSTSVERLSSGLRINKAADDAAGLAISQGLTSQINGIGQAVRNAQDGINVVQTADGALTEVQSILQRTRTLAVQAANDSNSSDARNNILTEVKQLATELDRIGKTTKFNGRTLLDGGTNNDLKFQVGSDGGSTSTSDNLNVRPVGFGESNISPACSVMVSPSNVPNPVAPPALYRIQCVMILSRKCAADSSDGDDAQIVGRPRHAERDAGDHHDVLARLSQPARARVMRRLLDHLVI